MNKIVFAFLAIGLSGCATMGNDVLPRVIAGAEAAKDVFKAVCEPVPHGAEKLCADLKVAVDSYDSVGGDVIRVASEVMNSVQQDAGAPVQK